MAIVTFWSSGKEETAKTLSVAAIATHMAIEHNYKILVISTIFNDDTLETCYWKEKDRELIKQIAGNKKDITSGIDGLVKATLSNKLAPEIVTDYTRLVFPDNRLEILMGSNAESYYEYEKIRQSYKDVIKAANEFYDYVFVDLNKGLDNEYIREILEISDLIVVNITQRLKLINEFDKLRKEDRIFKADNVIPLIGRYDKYSKYNAKNIARTLGYKGEISVIPYSTLFFEACNEGKTADFFLRFRKLNPSDRNALFIEEIKKAEDIIIERVRLLNYKNRR